MADIRVICAIGQRGQLGLKGHMPWEGNPGREYREDVERFFEITRGHVILCGPRTAASFPHWALAERTVVTIRSGDDPEATVARFPGRVVFIGGGPPVWPPMPIWCAIGTSPACPMTARPTASSTRLGSPPPQPRSLA